jgi:hypothetical protein
MRRKIATYENDEISDWRSMRVVYRIWRTEYRA